MTNEIIFRIILEVLIIMKNRTMATRAPLEHELFYVILLEIMFDVSSLDGNTGSADYSKKKLCKYISIIQAPLEY